MKDNIKSQITDQVQIYIWNRIYWQVKEVKDEIFWQVRDLIWDQVCDQVRDKVYLNVYNQLTREINDER